MGVCSDISVVKIPEPERYSGETLKPIKSDVIGFLVRKRTTNSVLMSSFYV